MNFKSQNVPILSPIVWMFPQGAVYVGPLPANKMHSHRAFQVLASEEKTIKITMDTKRGLRNYKVVGLPPFVKHTVSFQTARAVSIFYEPGFLKSASLEGGKNSPFEILDLSNDKMLRLLVDAVLKDRQGHIQVMRLFEYAAQASGYKLVFEDFPKTSDYRVNQILKELSSEVFSSSFLMMAKKVKLSESRLTHLFTQEMGMSFKSYYLWLKLRRAIEEVSKNKNLTYCAHEAGFSDLAHFSRIFSRTFGFPPSFLKTLQINSITTLEST